MLLLPYLMLALNCQIQDNTDTIERYYSKTVASSAEDCCIKCTADTNCAFACFATSQQECYQKDANATTPTKKSGVALIIVRPQPLGPTPGPTPPPTPPYPPLPAPKYKVELTEHSPEPVVSSANPTGGGASPCPFTFNPAYVEVAGQNTKGGVIVRTDGCNATGGSLSFVPCDVDTGICGDLDSSYQIPGVQGIQDPRVIFDKYSDYFYNFNYGHNNFPSDGCGGPGVPGGDGACTVLLSRTKTPMNATSWEHVHGGTYPWHRNGCCFIQPVGQRTYCIFGESGSEGPGSGLGIAYTMDISSGKFTQTN